MAAAPAATFIPYCHDVRRDADRVAGLLEANNIYNTKLLVNRVRPDMIQKNDMMSVRDVQVRSSIKQSHACLSRPANTISRLKPAHSCDTCLLP